MKKRRLTGRRLLMGGLLPALCALVTRREVTPVGTRLRLVFLGEAEGDQSLQFITRHRMCVQWL